MLCQYFNLRSAFHLFQNCAHSFTLPSTVSDNPHHKNATRGTASSFIARSFPALLRRAAWEELVRWCQRAVNLRRWKRQRYGLHTNWLICRVCRGMVAGIAHDKYDANPTGVREWWRHWKKERGWDLLQLIAKLRMLLMFVMLDRTYYYRRVDWVIIQPPSHPSFTTK